MSEIETRSELDNLNAGIQELEDDLLNSYLNDEEYDRKTKTLRTMVEIRDNLVKAESDAETKKKDRTRNWVDIGVKAAIGVLGVVVPAAVYIRCFDCGSEFEEEGVYKGQWMRSLISKIKPN